MTRGGSSRVTGVPGGNAMRRWLLLGGVLGVLGVWGWLASRAVSESSMSGARVSAPAPGVDPGGRSRRATPSEAPASRDSPLSIRGSVQGSRGAVAGATVLASREVPGESLSARSCEDSSPPGLAPTLLPCVSSERLSERVAHHQGEAPVIARATSAEDGSFSLEGLQAGRYALWVESAEGTGLWQDVEAGRRDVELRLSTGVRLSGLVTGESKDPQAGVRVTAIFKAHSRFFEALSDDTGHFELGPLPRGEYVLLASKAGWWPGQEPVLAYVPRVEHNVSLQRMRKLTVHAMHEGAPVREARLRLETPRMEPREGVSDAEGSFCFEGLMPQVEYSLTASQSGLGATDNVIFELAEGRPDALFEQTLDLELTLAAEVRGVVLDGERRPIEGATVFAFERVGTGTNLVGSARTDARGQYVMNPVKPGSLYFKVEADRFESTQDSFEEEGTPISAGVSTRDFVLSHAALVEVVLTSPEGQPVPGAELTLQPPGDDSNLQRGRTGPDGRFVFSPPSAGTYSLDVGGDGLQGQGLEVNAPTSVHLEVERSPVVVGEVVDETGTPVPRAEVSLWAEGPPTHDSLISFRTTDARGRFLLPARELGRYLITAELRQADVVQTVSRPVELLTEQASVQLRFEPGHALSGVVVDGAGRPREGVAVSLQPTRRVQQYSEDASGTQVLTGPDGRFTFHGVTDEPLELSVPAPRFSLQGEINDEPRSVTPVAPGARDVRIVLTHRASVYGRIVRADGSPLSDFLVNGQRQELLPGTFSWPILETGTLRLEFSELRQPGVVVVRRSVPVQDGVEQDLGTIVLGEP